MSAGEVFTATLIHEHAVVGMVTAAMQREAEHIRGTGEIDTDAVRQMVEFTQGFTDGCHHAKEERLLFPLLLERSPQAGGPVSVMLREHEAGRARIAAIATNIDAAADGDASARLLVADGLDSYASLLTSHIAKENNVLFPLADRALEEDERRWLAGEFERVQREEGAELHEHYRAMADALAQVAV